MEEPAWIAARFRVDAGYAAAATAAASTLLLLPPLALALAPALLEPPCIARTPACMAADGCVCTRRTGGAGPVAGFRGGGTGLEPLPLDSSESTRFISLVMDSPYRRSISLTCLLP